MKKLGIEIFAFARSRSLQNGDSIIAGPNPRPNMSPMDCAFNGYKGSVEDLGDDRSFVIYNETSSLVVPASKGWYGNRFNYLMNGHAYYHQFN